MSPSCFPSSFLAIISWIRAKNYSGPVHAVKMYISVHEFSLKHRSRRGVVRAR